jgi:hypothetical protein
MVKEENDQNNFLFSFKMKDGELEYFWEDPKGLRK